MRAEEILMRIPSQWKKLFITVPFLLAVFLLAAAPATRPGTMASKTPLFLPAVTYDSGGVENVSFVSSGSVAVADVNSDGVPDVIVGTFCAISDNSNACNFGLVNGSVDVLLGNGDGTFKAAVTYDSGGLGALSIAVADVNGDGKLDVVVANGASHQVGVLLGNGDGSFRPAVGYGAGGEVGSVAVADVNGDGKPDLLVANVGGLLGVLLGNGDGTFKAVVTYGSGGGPNSITVADLNGDGKPDLVAANICPTACNGSAGILLGNGDGTFMPAVTYGAGGVDPGSVAVADVNGDGKPDLVLPNFDGTVGVLLGHGDGTFQSVVTYDSGGTVGRQAAVVDVNGDGKLDLVVADSCQSFNCTASGAVGVLLGNGDGTFQPAVAYDSGGSRPHSLVVADVDGNGAPDILVANSCLPTDNQNCPGDGVVGVLLHAPVDTTPPVITISATPKVLWPPNDKMVPVTVSGTITDTGFGVNLTSAAYTVKDEYGEVQPTGAITLSSAGKYSFTVLLRASRRGSDLDGRRYTVTVRAKHNAGNSGSKTSAVTVPHDQGD
jgi:uncharacterized membrane protein